MIDKLLQSAESRRKSSLTSLLASSVDGMMIIRADGTFDGVSKSAEHLFGYGSGELGGQNVSCLMNDEDASRHHGYIQNFRKLGKHSINAKGRDLTGRHKDGSFFPIHISLGEFEEDDETFYTAIVIDLTERKRIENALREAQKIDALGQLTGGVAHDFNNLLTIILGNLELLMTRVELGAYVSLADEAIKAANLAADLTARMLAFARRSPLNPQIVQLNTLIDSFLPLLRRTLGEGISIETSLTGSAWPVKIDPVQFQTALVNLAVNARDAMPEGGKLLIETLNTEIATQTDGSDVKAGRYVTVRVKDTGHGMTKDVLHRVFEPFFTTKPVGRGTGLGLSMVYGFTKQSGGDVTIESEVGKGTTVGLHLPRHLEPNAVPDAPETASATAMAQGEVVLLVEDNDQVRQISHLRLEVMGYAVLEAVSGPAALAILQSGAAVDLVFTDLVMPGGLSGYEVARYVQEHHPTIPVLLTSGYAEELVNGDKLSASNLTLLRKPYSQAALAKALRKALET